MEKKKLSPILLIAAICLVTLAVLSLIGGLAYPQSAMMAFTSFGRQGLNSRQFTPPTGQNGTLNNNGQGNGGGGNFPDAPGMGNGGTFSGTPEAGRQGQFAPNGQNGTNPNRQFGTNNRSIFSWILPVGLGLFMLLAIITAIYLVLKKKWAGILALILAFLTLIVNAFAIYSQLGLARFMRTRNLGSLVFTIIEMVLALAVVVLLLLPKGRAVWAVKTEKSKSIIEDDDDDDDDDDDADENSNEILHPVTAGTSTAEAAKTQGQIANKMSNPISTSNLQQSKRGPAQKEEDDDDDDDED